jgi:hypothetical protein
VSKAYNEHELDNEESRLRDGLVGQRHRRLFAMNAEFHQQVYVLANMIRIWVDALAASAETADDRQKIAMELVMCEPVSTEVLADMLRTHGVKL